MQYTKHLAAFMSLMLLAANVHARSFQDSRAEKFTFFLAPTYAESKFLQFDNGAEADIDASTSLGFGFGYNFNRFLELNLTFMSSNAAYKGIRIIDNDPEDPEIPNGPVKISGSIYTSSLNFGVVVNLLSTALTPYIGANIGSTYIDSGVPTGEIGSGCYWDPWWWGYVCGSYALTHTTTKVNYGASLGLRYDFNRKLYIKGDANINYLDLSSSDTTDFINYRFIFGFMF